MGEYLERDGGQPCKLATVDDARYLTRDEAERLRGYDEGPALAGLLADPRTLWRFPWPAEESPDNPAELCRTIAGRSMFRSLAVDLADERAELLSRVKHGRVAVYLRHEDGHSEPQRSELGGGGLSVRLPCPLDGPAWAAAGLDMGNRPAPALTVYGERFDTDGRRRTVFRCAYCAEAFALEAGELATVRDALHQEAERAKRDGSPERVSWYRDLAARLAARTETEGQR